MTSKQSQVNTFNGGVNVDVNPLIAPENILSDCVNGTLLTYNGNELVLQTDIGNTAIKNATLPEGFVPLACKEHGGIIYIISHNPESKETQIGSFPSLDKTEVEYSINGIGNTVKDLFIDEEGNPKSSILLSETQLPIEFYKDGNELCELAPGDKYKITLDTISDVVKPSFYLYNNGAVTSEKININTTSSYNKKYSGQLAYQYKFNSILSSDVVIDTEGLNQVQMRWSLKSDDFKDLYGRENNTAILYYRVKVELVTANGTTLNYLSLDNENELYSWVKLNNDNLNIFSAYHTFNSPLDKPTTERDVYFPSFDFENREGWIWNDTSVTINGVEYNSLRITSTPVVVTNNPYTKAETIDIIYDELEIKRELPLSFYTASDLKVYKYQIFQKTDGEWMLLNGIPSPDNIYATTVYAEIDLTKYPIEEITSVQCTVCSAVNSQLNDLSTITIPRGDVSPWGSEAFEQTAFTISDNLCRIRLWLDSIAIEDTYALKFVFGRTQSMVSITNVVDDNDEAFEYENGVYYKEFSGIGKAKITYVSAITGTMTITGYQHLMLAPVTNNYELKIGTNTFELPYGPGLYQLSVNGTTLTTIHINRYTESDSAAYKLHVPDKNSCYYITPAAQNNIDFINVQFIRKPKQDIDFVVRRGLDNSYQYYALVKDSRVIACNGVNVGISPTRGLFDTFSSFDIYLTNRRYYYGSLFKEETNKFATVTVKTVELNDSIIFDSKLFSTTVSLINSYLLNKIEGKENYNLLYLKDWFIYTDDDFNNAEIVHALQGVTVESGGGYDLNNPTHLYRNYKFYFDEENTISKDGHRVVKDEYTPHIIYTQRNSVNIKLPSKTLPRFGFWVKTKAVTTIGNISNISELNNDLVDNRPILLGSVTPKVKVYAKLPLHDVATTHNYNRYYLYNDTDRNNVDWLRWYVEDNPNLSNTPEVIFDRADVKSEAKVLFNEFAWGVGDNDKTYAFNTSGMCENYYFREYTTPQGTTIVAKFVDGYKACDVSLNTIEDYNNGLNSFAFRRFCMLYKKALMSLQPLVVNPTKYSWAFPWNQSGAQTSDKFHVLIGKARSTGGYLNPHALIFQLSDIDHLSEDQYTQLFAFLVKHIYAKIPRKPTSMWILNKEDLTGNSDPILIESPVVLNNIYCQFKPNYSDFSFTNNFSGIYQYNGTETINPETYVDTDSYDTFVKLDWDTFYKTAPNITDWYTETYYEVLCTSQTEHLIAQVENKYIYKGGLDTKYIILLESVVEDLKFDVGYKFYYEVSPYHPESDYSHYLAGGYKRSQLTPFAACKKVLIPDIFTNDVNSIDKIQDDVSVRF